jgi:hypothetical protein
MATQLLIYEPAIPVSNGRHGDWCLEMGTGYAFCRSVNSVPLVAAEFPSAALEYAKDFRGNGNRSQPAGCMDSGGTLP